jgi:hypothetical protein
LTGITAKGGGRSRDWVVEDLRCRGKEDEDHHSRNFRRNMEVGRTRFSEDARRGRILVRSKFSGERDRDVFPAISWDGEGGGYCYMNSRGYTLS